MTTTVITTRPGHQTIIPDLHTGRTEDCNKAIEKLADFLSGLDLPRDQKDTLVDLGRDVLRFAEWDAFMHGSNVSHALGFDLSEMDQEARDIKLGLLDVGEDAGEEEPEEEELEEEAWV